MKTKEELRSIVERIASPNSPVGMDAVYVHALILDKLQGIERRLDRLEAHAGLAPDASTHAAEEPTCPRS